MCYQLTELYSACRCLYYVHAVDKCASYGRRAHTVQHRTTLVGYACTFHGLEGTYRHQDSNPVGANGYADSNDETTSQSRGCSIGSASTLISQPGEYRGDLSDELFRYLLLEPELQHILPRVVGEAQTQFRVEKHLSRFEKHLSRFLRRFAQDLKKTATTKSEIGTSNIIRRCSKEISRRIVQCYYNAEVNELRYRRQFQDEVVPLHFEQEEEEKEEEDENEEDENEDEVEAEDVDNERKKWMALHGNLKRFLFEGPPFESFKNSLKLFITGTRNSPTEQKISGTITNFAANLYDGFCSRYFGPKESAKTERLWWTCACGRKLYDDYEEIRPGALEDLRVFLAAYTPSTLPIIEAPLASGRAPSRDASRGSRLIQPLTTMIRSIFNSDINERQCQNEQMQKPELTDYPTSAHIPAVLSAHKFLLLCIPFMKWGSRLQQPDVCTIQSDRHFFDLLKKSYLKYRVGFPWRWFKCISRVEFVQLEMFSGNLVNICASPSMPSAQARQDYDYEPSDTNPPIGMNMFMHLLENPHHAPVLPILFKRIPVKRQARLEVCPHNGFSRGWGVQFIESFSTLAVLLVGLVGFLLSLISSIIWTVVRNDVQGGFGIGAFVLAFFLFGATRLHSIA